MVTDVEHWESGMESVSMVLGGIFLNVSAVHMYFDRVPMRDKVLIGLKTKAAKRREADSQIGGGRHLWYIV